MSKSLLALGGLSLCLIACKDSVSGNTESSSSALSSVEVSSSSTDSLSSSSAPSSSSVQAGPSTPAGFPQIVKALPLDSSKWLSAPQTQVKLATWSNFYKAAFSLTFDDGFHSDYTVVRPILNKYGIKGTFFVITHTLQEPGSPIRGRGGNWDEFQTLASEGHEIGSHTQTHPDLTSVDSVGLIYELDSAAAEIRSRIPGNNLLTLSTPYCNSSSTVRTRIGQTYLASRDCNNGILNPLPSMLLRVGSSILSYDTNRTLATDLVKMEALEKSIESSVIAAGKWHTYLAHEVVPFDSIGKFTAYHPVSAETFDPFVSWLKQKMDAGDLWVCTMGEAARYLTQKNLTKVGILSESETEIHMSFDDGLNDQDYNQAISAEITLPSGWSSAKAMRAGTEIPTTMVSGKLRLSAIPKADEIVLSKQ